MIKILLEFTKSIQVNQHFPIKPMQRPEKERKQIQHMNKKVGLLERVHTK